MVPDRRAEALVAQGAELLGAGQPEAAIPVFRQAAQAAPEDARAWLGLGYALVEAEQPAEAIAPLRRGLELAGPSVEPMQKLATALARSGDHPGALQILDAAVALEPGATGARFQRSVQRLQMGDYAQGWPDYELRWRTTRFLAESRGQVAEPMIPALTLAPEPLDLTGRRVLLVGEQGIGDQVMFASLLPDLLAVASSVVCVCEPRLVRLFRASFPQATFVAPAEARIDSDEVDEVVALGSLPHALRRASDDFPGAAYLAPSERVRSRWAEQLGASGRRRIGLVWRGGGPGTRAAVRSLPLDALAPILAVPGCEFVSLQHGETDAERAAFPQIRRFGDAALSDFEEMAGLIANLDAVVSVQGSAVHLAGALGTPCLAMLPFSAEWRYGAAGAQMPWYRSVRLFRQPRLGDWAPVLADIAAALA